MDTPHVRLQALPQPSPTRRPGFPSWSWVGWSAKASLDGGELKELPSNLENLIIELNNGEFVQLDDFYSTGHLGEGAATYPRALHFDAIVLPTEAFKGLRNANGLPSAPKESELRRDMSRNKYAEFEVESVEEEKKGWRLLEEGIWSAVVLTMRDTREITCLIVKWEEGRASRVGMCYLEEVRGGEMKIEWNKRWVCLV
jgi:hypothetical protein